MAALEVVDLEVRLHSPRGVVHAVDGVSFSVEPGRVHAVVGESGSGKSTLLRAIVGLLPESAEMSGAIRVRGSGEGRGGVSIVFQEPMTALNPVMTVGRQISEAPMAKLGMSKKAARARALALMEQVGIPDPARRYDAYPHQLSGGLRQRVLIAIALSSEPVVILCDEPTTALDVTIQQQVLGLLARLTVEERVAVVYVTHDLAVVAELCDSLSVMYAGRFLENGSVDDVFTSPRHPYTLGLIRALPRLEGPSERLIPIPGSPPDLIDPPSGCGFAPRCPFAESRCTSVVIPLVEVEQGRQTACIRHLEIFPPAGEVSA
jgi:oligopeptide/dipeptide ABC transporter ATP-binding protein